LAGWVDVLVLDGVIRLSGFLQWITADAVLRYAKLSAEAQFKAFQMSLSGREVFCGFQFLPASVKSRMRRTTLGLVVVGVILIWAQS